MRSLSELLEHAKKNVTYYDNVISDKIESFCIEEEVYKIFKNVPIVDKQTIKFDYERFIDKSLVRYGLKNILNTDKYSQGDQIHSLPYGNVVVEYTSGTSGMPFMTLKTLQERIQLGKNLWDLRNEYYPAKPSDFFDFIHEVPFLSLKYKRNGNRSIQELEFLSSSNYSWWHISTRLLDNYCACLSTNTYQFNKLKVIENNGSYISDQDKVRYAEVFDCLVANNYGCREVWTIAYDCSCGYLHINDRSILFELVDENNNIISEPDRIGSVVVTSLVQKCMPFIRYKLGDKAQYLEGECKCGKNSRRIVVMPDRHVIAGTNMYGSKYFKDAIILMTLRYNIKDFNSISIVQTAYDTFSVNIKGNHENRNIIEKCFVESCNSILMNTKYKYIFKYNEDLQPKNIFTVDIKNLTN